MKSYLILVDRDNRTNTTASTKLNSSIYFLLRLKTFFFILHNFFNVIFNKLTCINTSDNYYHPNSIKYFDLTGDKTNENYYGSSIII